MASDSNGIKVPQRCPVASAAEDADIMDGEFNHEKWAENKRAKTLIEQKEWLTEQQRLADEALPESILTKRRFNHAITPPPIRGIYTLAGQIIATPGNLVAIASEVKTGKSAVIGAMCAASMLGESDIETDLLSFASSNPKGFATVHIDSEQSPDDHWHCVRRALKRAGLNKPPEWFHSYCLTGLQHQEAWQCVKTALQQASESHGGIHSLLLDGIADMVKDPNDAGECNAFVAEVQDLAIQFDCPIVGVIHFNPGTSKTRGHLGSQFERKAETNLRLEKDDGITEIWSDKQRRAPIPKGNGPCFAWSDQAGMHISVQNPAEAKAEARIDAKRTAMRQDAEAVFARVEKSALKHKQLVELLCVAFGLKPAGARRRIENLVSSLIVSKDDSGLYTLTQ